MTGGAQRGLQVATLAGSGRTQRLFLVRAALCMLVLYAVFYYPHMPDSIFGGLIEGYLRVLARAAAALLRLLGERVTVGGTTILGGLSLQVVKSCSSLDAQSLFVAAVLAFPARVGSKAVGLLGGLTGLGVLNVLRIVGLYYVGLQAQSVFERVHEELMPLLLVACAVAGFLVWTRLAQARPPLPAAPRGAS